MSKTHHERRRSDRRLKWTAALTSVFFLTELFGGFWSNSLALLSDAGHMLADMAALFLILLSFRWASKPPTERLTFGYHRLEILAALLNGAFLFLVAFQIAWEAFTRFLAPEPVRADLMFSFALVGLIVNVAGVALLHSERHRLATRSALYHLVGDTLSSIGVIGAALVIHFTGWLLADPIVSILVSILIGRSSYRIIREAVDVLLEATPAGVRLDRVRETILGVRGVRDLHDLHVWTITSGFHAASAHIGVANMHTEESDRIVSEISRRLRESFSITHTTLQVETFTPPAELKSITA